MAETIKADVVVAGAGMVGARALLDHFGGQTRFGLHGVFGRRRNVVGRFELVALSGAFKWNHE